MKNDKPMARAFADYRTMSVDLLAFIADFYCSRFNDVI